MCIATGPHIYGFIDHKCVTKTKVCEQHQCNIKDAKKYLNERIKFFIHYRSPYCDQQPLMTKYNEIDINLLSTIASGICLVSISWTREVSHSGVFVITM